MPSAPKLAPFAFWDFASPSLYVPVSTIVVLGD